MKSRKFVVTSITPWDFEYGSNIQDISFELSKEFEVLFVNIPIKLTELWSDKLKWGEHRKSVVRSKKNEIKKIDERLYVLTTPAVIFPINQLKFKVLFNFLNWWNNRKYARCIKNALAALDFEDHILINDNDFYSGQLLPKMLDSNTSVYYLRDNFRAMEYWQANGHHAEPKTIKNYDLVLSNSVFLANYARKYNPNSKYVGQGCDVEYFSKAFDTKDIPRDIAFINSPIVGYVGALNAERLDIELMQFLAEKNESMNFVLVGPEDDAFKKSNLHKVKNVFFLGPKDFSELVNYVNCFDVCINPQILNEITIGNYPRKVDEYLAVGKPVVTTATETMRPFKEVCYLAYSREEYSDLLNVAITEDNIHLQLKRKEFAQAHTWQNSVNKMVKIIDDLAEVL